MRARGRLGYLDTTRGLAACAVFLSHCIYTCGFPPAILSLQNSIPIHFLFDGHSAVGLFFVLSGLVLSLPYVGQENGPSLIPFYLSRGFRIYPAFLAALALTVLVRECVVRYGVLSSFWSSPVTWHSFFEQAVLVIPSSESRLLKQDWSLEWELKFSLLIPVLIFLKRRGWGVYLAAVVIGLWGLKVEKFLFHFALGVAIASSWDTLRLWFHGLAASLRWSWGLLALYLYAFRYTPPLNLPFVSNSDVQWYIGAIGSGMCLIAVAGSHSVHRQLERAPMLWLGQRSYSFFWCITPCCCR